MLRLHSASGSGRLRRGIFQAFFCLTFSHSLPAQDVRQVTLAPDGRFVIDGAATFPIGYTSGPELGSLSPARNDALAELKKEGYVFQLWYCPPSQWGPERESFLDSLMKQSLQQGTRVVISIADLQHVKPDEASKIAELRRVVLKYRNHPSLLFWKGEDEPQWGKIPPENLRVYYETIHALDANHPIWITQAPRGTAADLRPYSRFYDIGAIDIYPVSYPPGIHSGTANKELSVVGDYTRLIREAGNDDPLGHAKPTMMVLQICWSGVTKPGKTLRFPTFPEERYMTYEAIVNGARGLVFFGGNVRGCWNDQDTALGWNWSFYERVLRPVLDELRPEGPLYPALIAPDSKLPIHAGPGDGVEFVVRESGDSIYVLATYGESKTSEIKFTGLPQGVSGGNLLYEDPRAVKVADGSFTDWFGPHEVHLYRFRRPMK